MSQVTPSELCKNPSCHSLHTQKTGVGIPEEEGTWVDGYCPACLDALAKKETTRIRKLPLA